MPPETASSLSRTTDVPPLVGVWAALPTPWTGNDTVDGGLVIELVRRYREAGVDGVYTTGTDGEMHTLELADFETLIDAFATATRETALPTQAGCTWHHTHGVVARVAAARERGIRAVQVALPSWVPLSGDETVRFYAALQEATPDVAFIHYNIARAGRFLTGADYRAILEVAPNLLGTKQTGGDVPALIELVEATPGLHHFVVDHQIVPGALFGATGFYSFLVNLAPRFTVALWHDCQRGDWAEAARKRRLVESFFREWRAMVPELTASPALAKLATRAGIAPEMPLRIREPYVSGTERQATALRDLLTARYPELLLEP